MVSALLNWLDSRTGYSAHVFLLPACLIVFAASHVYLMRRHGISGPIEPLPGPPLPFYPHHALKDTLAMALVFAALVGAAAMFPVPLALPFLDRSRDRRLQDRPVVAAGFLVLGVGVVALTSLGLRDSPASEAEVDADCAGGRDFRPRHALRRLSPCRGWRRADRRPAPGPRSGVGEAHVRDPEVLVPGSRAPLNGAMTAGQAFSVVSYMRRVRAGVGAPPAVSPDMATTSLIVGRYCASCHMLDGEGGSAGPDLTAIGKTRDAFWLKEWITDPSVVDPAASMPAFGETLSEEELSALVKHLAGRK